MNTGTHATSEVRSKSHLAIHHMLYRYIYYIHYSGPQPSESSAQNSLSAMWTREMLDLDFESEHTKMVNEKIREHIAKSKQS